MKFQFLKKTNHLQREKPENKNIKERLDRLYECRDLEINNLWQRSVFLAVFLTLTASGYGVLFSKFLDISNANSLILHLAAIGLSVIGLIFSIIWIIMGKASKAWYEVYENAISEYEKKYWKELEFPPNSDGTDTDYRMGAMRSKEIDNCLISNKGGAYSPSKINILIGHVFRLFWIFLLFIHTNFLFINVKIKCEIEEVRSILFSSLFALITVAFFYYLSQCIIKKQAESSFLK